VCWDVGLQWTDIHKHASLEIKDLPLWIIFKNKTKQNKTKKKKKKKQKKKKKNKKKQQITNKKITVTYSCWYK